MFLLWQIGEHLITHPRRRTLGQSHTCFFFQILQHVVKPVILMVRHNFAAFLIICSGCLIEQGDKILHLLYFFFFVFKVSHCFPPKYPSYLFLYFFKWRNSFCQLLCTCLFEDHGHRLCIHIHNYSMTEFAVGNLISLHKILSISCN